jgi:hypothetical protein
MGQSEVQIETLADPQRYAAWQIDVARRVAVLLGGGRLILCEKPLG